MGKISGVSGQDHEGILGTCSSTDLGHHAGLLCKLGTGGTWSGLGCLVFSLSVLTVVSGAYRSRSKKEKNKTLLWGEAVIGLSGFRQQLIKGLQERSLHCHDEPSTEKSWVKPSCILSLGRNEETVTESRAVMVLDMPISGVLFCIWILFNIVTSCHPRISPFSAPFCLLREHLSSVSCVPVCGLCYCFGPAVLEQGGISVSLFICKCLYSTFLNGMEEWIWIVWKVIVF